MPVAQILFIISSKVTLEIWLQKHAVEFTPMLTSLIFFNTFDLWFHCEAAIGFLLSHSVRMTVWCTFTAESAAFCCELSSSASVRHKEHVNNSVLCSVAASLLMTKRSNLLGMMLWCRMRREEVSLCCNKLDGLQIRAEWLCVFSGRDFYH